MSKEFKPCECYPSCKHHKCDCYQLYCMMSNSDTKSNNKHVENREYTLEEFKELIKRKEE